MKQTSKIITIIVELLKYDTVYRISINSVMYSRAKALLPRICFIHVKERERETEREKKKKN